MSRSRTNGCLLHRALSKCAPFQRSRSQTAETMTATATGSGTAGQHIKRLVLAPLLCTVVIVSVLLTGNVCQSKPTIMFPFPASLTASLPSLSSYTRQFMDGTRGRSGGSPMKTYSGYRISNDSLVMIYWHDQAIAIVELGPAKLLLNCEIIEIYDDKEGQNILHKLSDLNRPLQIQFKEMIQLMEQCQIVDRQNQYRQAGAITAATASSAEDGSARRELQQAGFGGGVVATATTTESTALQSPLTLFSGIIPGTKWCGTGDIASTYADLGAQATMDRCCRTHDLCPTKVRAYQTRYGLENNSLYTKSHCTCDDILFTCLKRTNTSSAQLMGSIYFNLVQVPCVLDTGRGGKAAFRRAREGF